MATSSPLESVPIDPQVLSFFHAIKENPDDDTSRLIFADWLQEHGNAADAARGEFLRLSVLRHRLSPDEPTYGLLKRREGELFTEHRWTWLGPLVDAARKWSFERGMIQITAQAEKLLTSEMKAWVWTSAALWIDDLTLSELAHNQILRLAYSPLLVNVNRLDLSGNANRTTLELILNAFIALSLRFLRHLRLANCRLSEGIAPLLNRPELGRLTVLDLESNRLRYAAAQALRSSTHLKKVAELRLGDNRFTAEGIALLRQAFGERVRF
jgi:uncharacterized protein (TIGR02996 family)